MMRITALLLIALLYATSAHAESTDSIKIGWSGPLTGNSAVLGIDSVQAAQIAIDEANAVGGIAGRKIELIVEDDQYDTAKGVAAYSKLVSQGVVAVLSSTYGAVFATAKKALSDKVIVVDPLDCNNDIARLEENTFCIATESESIGRVISHDISQRKLDPVAVIYDEKNPFMEVVQRVIQTDHNNSPNAYFEGVDQSASDFKSTLLRVKSKGSRSLVFLGHDPMGQAMREAREIGIPARFYTLGTITSPGYQKLAGKAASGTLVAYWEAPRGHAFDNFITKFTAKVGRPPILELASIPTYDATKIIIAALSSGAANLSRVDTNNAKKFLYNLKEFDGLSGTITMDPDGAVRSIREAIYSYENGNLTRSMTSQSN